MHKIKSTRLSNLKNSSLKNLLAGLAVSLSFLFGGVYFSNAQVTDVYGKATLPCVNLTVNMVHGSKDRTTRGEVSDLQSFLRGKNYLKSYPTGYFGLATLAAVKSFQSDNNITPNGVVGPLTRRSVSDVSCDKVAKNDQAVEINQQNTYRIKAKPEIKPEQASSSSQNPLRTTNCEYPAPPAGCTYIQGDNYIKNNNCGMTLICSGATYSQ